MAKPPPACRRRRALARLCEHLLPSPAAGDQQLASEVKAILEALGPEPLRVGCQKIHYKLDVHLPPLKEREAQGPADALKPELIPRIKALSPPPYKPLDGENQQVFIARLMASDAAPPPAGDDGASDGSLQVLKSLLFLGAGALDEAHTLAVTTQVSNRYKGSGARRDATYVHALCHRREGRYEEYGEDHRSGWMSAGMFFNAIDKHPLFPKVLEEATRLAAGKVMIQADVRKMGSQWDPLRFVKVLMELDQVADWDAGGQRVLANPAVQASVEENAEFCGKLMNAEWRLLVDHVMAQTKALA